MLPAISDHWCGSCFVRFYVSNIVDSISIEINERKFFAQEGYKAANGFGN